MVYLVAVNRSARTAGDEPPTVVTVMSCAPAVSAGEIATIVVLVFAMKLLAATPPNFTTVAAVNLAPVIVTDVPPPTGPARGDTVDTTGAATAVNRSGVTANDEPPTVVTMT